LVDCYGESCYGALLQATISPVSIGVDLFDAQARAQGLLAENATILIASINQY